MTVVQHATASDVRCDPFSGTPRAVRLGDEHVPVLSIERIREESAAYPAEIGPRTLFVVRTPRTRLRLTFEHRSRRWSVDQVSAPQETRAA
jgi:hypothetical protein